MSNVLLRRAIRGVLLTLVVLFFLFPMFWVLLMSFQTNRDILRTPPSLFFTPTISNYVALISGEIQTSVGTLPVDYMKNLWNSALLSACAVALSLLLGVPAAYAFARFKFRLGEDIAFTLLSFRFAPPTWCWYRSSLTSRTSASTTPTSGLSWSTSSLTLPSSS